MSASDDLADRINENLKRDPDFYKAPERPDTPFTVSGFVEHRTPESDYIPSITLPGRVNGQRQQWYYKFDNGYGASVITGWGAYGTPSEPYELAVMHDEQICYHTDLTDDVIGYLDVAAVNDTLSKIEMLPQEDNCEHNHHITEDTEDTDGEGLRST